MTWTFTQNYKTKSQKVLVPSEPLKQGLIKGLNQTKLWGELYCKNWSLMTIIWQFIYVMEGQEAFSLFYILKK